jgi:hypothetical protein
VEYQPVRARGGSQSRAGSAGLRAAARQWRWLNAAVFPPLAGQKHGLALLIRVWLSVFVVAISGTAALAQTAPVAPTGLTATALSGSLIQLSWTDNSDNETGFGVWRKDGAGSWVQIAVAPANATSYVDRHLSPSTTYDYRVRAHNNAGASIWSNEIQQTTPYAPAAPMGLLALTVSSTEISLSWSDRSTDETGFGIWRKSPGGDWVRIAVAPANAEFFLDSGLTANTAYQYHVRAHNGPSASDWSNEATGSTDNVVSIQHSAPTVADSPTTRVTVNFTPLPGGYRLFQSPRVLMIDASSRVYVLQPFGITQWSPLGAGYRDLNTSNYLPGVYHIRGEMTYIRPDGSIGGVASPWTEFTVPPASLASVNVSRGSFSTIFGAGSQSGEVRLTRLPFGQDGVVTLSSSNPPLAQVPASVTVPSWTYVASFAITVATVTSTTPVTITASYRGTSKTLPLTLVATRRVAVYRPSTSEWLIREVDGTQTRVVFGAPNDQPVPADYLGTGRAQMAVFRPGTQEWFMRNDAGGTTRIQWGGTGDKPVPGDYLGLGRAQVAIYRPATGDWGIRNPDGTATVVHLGEPGDQPVPADYLGLGHAQIAVFRPSTREWFIRRADGSVFQMTWGEAGEQPAPADFQGLRHAQIATYNALTERWSIRHDDGTALLLPSLGGGGERWAVPSDYFGQGHDQAAMFQNGQWLIRYGFSDQPFLTLTWGASGDIPVPANYSLR